MRRSRPKHETNRHVYRSSLDGGVGHVLVLVFAATRRQLALRAARVIERAVRHVAFFRNAICKSIVYGIISHGRIETKHKSI